MALVFYNQQYYVLLGGPIVFLYSLKRTATRLSYLLFVPFQTTRGMVNKIKHITVFLCLFNLRGK